MVSDHEGPPGGDSRRFGDVDRATPKQSRTAPRRAAGVVSDFPRIDLDQRHSDNSHIVDFMSTMRTFQKDPHARG